MLHQPHTLLWSNQVSHYKIALQHFPLDKLAPLCGHGFVCPLSNKLKQCMNPKSGKCSNLNMWLWLPRAALCCLCPLPETICLWNIAKWEQALLNAKSCLNGRDSSSPLANHFLTLVHRIQIPHSQSSLPQGVETTTKFSGGQKLNGLFIWVYGSRWAEWGTSPVLYPVTFCHCRLSFVFVFFV